jgi:hypothetical protein
MYRRIIRSLTRCLATVCAALVLFGAVATASAQGQTAQLGIKPLDVSGSYFSLTMKPGETRELMVELANFGTAPARARTYAADAYSIVNGGFGAKLDGEEMSGPTHWLDYQADTLDLAPRAGVHRSFKISVPADTKPGDYITSLAIQSAESQPTNSTGIAIRQVVRQVIAVAINVPGPALPRLEIGDATYRTVAGRSMVAVVVKNTGNVHLKPAGEFILRDTNGAEVSRYPITMDTLYAGMSTFIEVPFDGKLNTGEYTVALSLADAKLHVQSAALPKPLSVPEIAPDAPPPPIGAPQTAAINQPASSSLGAAVAAGLDLRTLLIGASLLIALSLFGVYFFGRARRARV